MATRKIPQTPKSNQPERLHKLQEEVKKLPLKERVPHLEQLFKAGTIDEAEFVFLGERAINEKLEDFPGSDKDYAKLHLQFGSKRLYQLYRGGMSFRKLAEEARQRWLAEALPRERATQVEAKLHALTLAELISGVLTHPEVPAPVYDALAGALTDLLSGPGWTDTPAGVQFSLDRYKEEEEEEESSFTVELDAVGSNKIAVIAAVQRVTGKQPKEARDLVEAAPKAVKEGMTKAEAEDIQTKLEEAGATVTLKQVERGAA